MSDVENGGGGGSAVVGSGGNGGSGYEGDVDDEATGAYVCNTRDDEAKGTGLGLETFVVLGIGLEDPDVEAIDGMVLAACENDCGIDLGLERREGIEGIDWSVW